MFCIQTFIEFLENPAHAAYASLLVSLGSLFASIGAMVVSNRTARKLLEVEQARDTLASKQVAKANMAATLLRPAKHTFRLRVENRGSGAARDVSVKLDGTPLAEHPVFSDNIPEKKEFPPGSSIEYRLVLSLDVPRPRMVRTEWTDDSGEPGQNEMAL